ncbi:hypothetical protein HPB47_027710 [Ixodes persulcatus]|uniref:Uncharacterized protein n=1 Tax=Ixodes persulcatus TaxID=34615 RepID=A0AC60PV49_IXOPE|nr:hypothetical protein HPB47_027710 [Ixodes persulcatus]
MGNYSCPKQKQQAGVPQGGIHSPTLFKLALKNLPGQLERIPDLKSALYADDITLWCNRGSPAHQEKTIKEGLDTIQAYAKAIGLRALPWRQAGANPESAPSRRASYRSRRLSGTAQIGSSEPCPVRASQVYRTKSTVRGSTPRPAETPGTRNARDKHTPRSNGRRQRLLDIAYEESLRLVPPKKEIPLPARFNRGLKST